MSTQNFALIPVSQKAEEEVGQVFSQTFFGNVNTFIAMFNAGVLNRSYDENKDYSELVENSYGNVYKNKNILVVQSPEEYQASELAALFDDWKTISRLRREINEGIANNELNQETVLYIGSNGVIYTVDADRKQMFSSKLSRVTKEVIQRILGFSTVRGEENFVDDYAREDGYSENNEFSLDSDALISENDQGNEDEEDEVTDLEGKELPENASSRSVKVSDITEVDDSFIALAYEVIGK